jgi:hypothetical protein
MGKKKHRKECLEFLYGSIMDDYDHTSAKYRRMMTESLLKDALSHRSLPELGELVRKHTPQEPTSHNLMAIFEALTALKSIRSMATQLLLLEDDPVTGTVRQLHRDILEECKSVVGEGTR